MRALRKLLPVVAVAFTLVITSCGSEHVATPVDTTPPLAPVGLAVEGDTHLVMISWAANAEPDLAGYNVYSSSYEDGPFGEVNEDLLLCPWCYDSPTPMAITYYMVTAVDESGNESAYSQITGIYFNTSGGRDVPSWYVN
jgi:fibronectin type 3 domain-containing protein